MKTYLPVQDAIQQKWHLIDAEGQILGRLAVRITTILRGRDKAIYTPHIDTGDFVVVINAEKVVLTGKKEEQKIYEDYSGYMSGRKLHRAKTVRSRDPQRLIRDAVKGMMPRNRLARKQLRKLKIHAGADHPHQAQNPQYINTNS